MLSEKYVDEIVKLKTLTPIFIGDDEGSDLSPITDFVVAGDKILIIDQKKFESYLNKDIELIDEFVEEIKNNSKNFDLRLFIKNKLNIDLDEITKYKIDVEGYISQNTVKKFISTLGKPFIPGSSIKGAIRTAVIYNYFLNDDHGKNIINNLLNVSKKKDELEYKKKSGIKLNDKEYEEYKQLSELKGIKKYFDKIYNELYLFKTSEYGHEFRNIKFSDSHLLTQEDTKIVELSVEYLNKKDNKTAAWKQILNENTKTEFSLNIEKNIKDKFLQPLNAVAHHGIFKILNKFSKDIIEFELTMYRDFIEIAKDKTSIEDKLKGIIDFYNDLLIKIDSSKDNFAILRIGGGKTYFDNSIGLALYKTDKEAFKKFRKMLGFWKHTNGQFVDEDSPITRTFYYDKSIDKFLPLGWCVIYLKNNQVNIEEVFGKQEKINQKSIEITQAVTKIEELDLSKLSKLGKVSHSKKS